MLCQSTLLLWKDIALHVAYIHPVEPYVPRSISLKTMPFTIIKRQLRTKVIQDSFTISPATKAVLVFLTQESPHLCVENELDKRAKAGAGVNALGATLANGKFGYDSRSLHKTRDAAVDPREPSALATGNAQHADAGVLEVDASTHLEPTAPMHWSTLQVQLSSDVQPAQMLTEQDPPKGLVSRAWALYTAFIAKSAGYRGSVMSFSEFSGYHSANYGSAPRCGSRGVWHAFNIQNPSGTLSSDLQLRGTLSGTPSDDAKQFVTIMALSESMFDIQYQGDGNPVPMLTRISPLS
jgi:hypothetical protein